MLQQDQKLNIFSATFLNKSLIIRSEAIDSKDKFHDLVSFIESIPRKSKRISCLQINSPEYEWDLIQHQHLYLTQLKNSCAHLVFPLDPLMISSLPYELTAKTNAKICYLVNAEGWLVYASWIYERVAEHLKYFKLEASEEYPLQAVFEDLGHECRSLFLEDYRNMLKGLFKRMEDEEVISLSLEREIVWVREQIRKLLKTYYSVLNQIVLGINAIESIHPELIPIKKMAYLLKLLIGSEIEELKLDWFQKVMLLQLLDQKLDVVAIVNCDMGGERTCFVLSIREAISEMKDPVQTILRWKECVKEKNLGKKNETIAQFQKTFFEMLKETCLPLKVSDRTIPNPNLLYLLPSSMIEFNSETGEPIKITQKL